MSLRMAWVVVAEDNRPDVFLIREALDQEGLNYRLDSVDNGDEMLRFIDSLEADVDAPCPDVFLIDLNLPRRSGGEILSCMRASRRCADIPAIVISSSDAPGDRELAATFGAKHYFRKPSDLSEFLKIAKYIREAVEQHPAAW